MAPVIRHPSRSENSQNDDETNNEKTNTGRKKNRPPIVNRSFRFHLPKSRVLDWDVNGKHNCAFMNSLSIFFPVGEQFFISSVKRHQYAVPKDSKLYGEMRSFVQQESTHSREHELYNEALRQHAPVGIMEFIVEVVLSFFAIWPRRFSMGGTAALEHLTSTLSHTILCDLSQLKNSEPHYVALWRWHSHEEIEHKAVAFDVYTAAYGRGPLSYALRMITFIYSYVFFMMIFIPFFIYISYKSGILFDLKGWLFFFRFHWGQNGALRRVMPLLFDYIRPGFHPWDHDNSNLLLPLPDPPS